MRTLTAVVPLLLGGIVSAQTEPPAEASAAETPIPEEVLAAALPREKRIAAVILPASSEQEGLALDLTEILIATLARRGALTLVGAQEFRSQLGVSDPNKALACLENAACLGRAGVSLGVTQVVAGSVGQRGKDYFFALSLFDIASGKLEAQTFTLVAGALPALINAVREEAKRVLEPRPKAGAVRVTSENRGARVYMDDAFVGTTPVRRDGLDPGPRTLRVEKEGHHAWLKTVQVPAGTVVDVKLALDALPARRKWPTYLAWASLAASVVLGASGVFAGVLSQEEPESETRAGYLESLDRKSRQATAANILFGVSGALALTSAGTFYFYWDDIFGR